MTIKRLHRDKANNAVHFWSALASDQALAQAGAKEANKSSFNWSTKPELEIFFGSTSTDSRSKKVSQN